MYYGLRIHYISLRTANLHCENVVFALKQITGVTGVQRRLAGSQPEKGCGAFGGRLGSCLGVEVRSPGNVSGTWKLKIAK